MSDGLDIRTPPRGSRDLYELSNGDTLLVRPWGDGYAVTHRADEEHCCWTEMKEVPTLPQLGAECARLSDPSVSVIRSWRSQPVRSENVVMAGTVTLPECE